MTVSLYSRYYGLEAIETNGKVSLTQRLIGAPVSYSDSILHTLIGNETLEQLAAHYYGRENIWWRIADANPGNFPLDWRAGDVIVIPPIRVATRTPRR